MIITDVGKQYLEYIGENVLLLLLPPVVDLVGGLSSQVARRVQAVT